MPEHDTFDLDAAFRHLDHDVAGLSSPRGAAAAVSAARRRRRTTITGAVAGLALVVGAVTAVQGVVTDHDTIGPADLPSPAPLDATHLTAATSGWTPAWTGKTRRARQLIEQTFGGPCTWRVKGDPSAMTYLGDQQDDAALISMSRGTSGSGAARNAWQLLARDMGACPEATLMTSTDAGRAHVRLYRVTQGEQLPPSYTWVVSTGEGVGLLTIMRVATPPPTTTQRAVGRALLAAVQDPASYVVDLSPSEPSPFVNETDFARATAGWENGWSPNGSGRAGPAACLESLPSTTGTSMRIGLGGNGRQEFATLGSATEARHVVTSTARALRACDTVHYSVVRSLHDAHSMVVVIASSSQVVWMAQRDASIGIVRVPAAGATPPDRVTTRVEGLLLAALAAFARE
jgi:hypothetical protein